MEDYSQNGEQREILKVVKPEPGRFLDVGSFNAKVFSNTRALYELGWSGVMIEPSPAPMRGLIGEYGNDDRIELVQAAMSLTPGMLKLSITDDAVSTASASVRQEWAQAGGYIGSVWVPTLTWADIANRWGGFDFCNIDAEGMSADLFLEMIRLGIIPSVVCLEMDAGRDREVNVAATGANYRMVFSNAANSIYAQ